MSTGKPSIDPGDPDVLDATMVATMHRLEMVAHLYPTFLAGLPEQLAALRTALVADDRARIRQHAHRIRGSAAQLGAAALAAVLADIEHAVAGAEDGPIALPLSDAAIDRIVEVTILAMSRELDVALGPS